MNKKHKFWVVYLKNGGRSSSSNPQLSRLHDQNLGLHPLKKPRIKNASQVPATPLLIPVIGVSPMLGTNWRGRKQTRKYRMVDVLFHLFIYGNLKRRTAKGNTIMPLSAVIWDSVSERGKNYHASGYKDLRKRDTYSSLVSRVPVVTVISLGVALFCRRSDAHIGPKDWQFSRKGNIISVLKNMCR